MINLTYNQQKNRYKKCSNKYYIKNDYKKKKVFFSVTTGLYILVVLQPFTIDINLLV